MPKKSEDSVERLAHSAGSSEGSGRAASNEDASTRFAELSESIRPRLGELDKRLESAKEYL